VEERDYTAKDGSLKKSYDIKILNKEAQISKQLEELNSRVMKIQLMVEKIGQHLSPEKPDYPEFQGEPDFNSKPEEEVQF